LEAICITGSLQLVSQEAAVAAEVYDSNVGLNMKNNPVAFVFLRPL